MKTSFLRPLAFGTVLLSLALSSCVDPYYGYGPGFGPPPPAQGAVAGGLLGAAAGGIIGNQSHRGLEGAAVGGLLGALAGGALQSSYQQGRYYNNNPGYYNSGYGYGGGCRSYNSGGYYRSSYGPMGYDPYAFGNNWQ